MHVHINHQFCTESIWGGMYHCSYSVSIQRTLSYDQERYKTNKAAKYMKNLTDKERRNMATRDTMVLNDKVFKWLLKNVKNNAKDGTKGFCVGTDAYNDFYIFFYRRSDAMKFIKRWSSHKKPTTYFDYFKGIRRELNPKTKTLQVVK